MALRANATTIPAIMPASCSIQTATISKRCSTARCAARRLRSNSTLSSPHNRLLFGPWDHGLLGPDCLGPFSLDLMGAASVERRIGRHPEGENLVQPERAENADAAVVLQPRRHGMGSRGKIQHHL